MKMMGKNKQIGRCPIHGQNCVLGREIRDKPKGRAAEKREWKVGRVAECTGLENQRV